MKTLWKGFTVLGAIQNMSDSWEGVKTSPLMGLAEVNLTLMDAAEEGPRPDVTAGAAGAAAEPGRALEPQRHWGEGPEGGFLGWKLLPVRMLPRLLGQQKRT